MPRALLETRLHRPNFAHIAREFAAARHIADTRVKHRVHRVHERRMVFFAVLHSPIPALAHIRPQHARQQKAGRNRFSFADAAVGIAQSGVNQRLFGAFHDHIQQRINAPRHAQILQLGDGSQRVTGLQQFQHFVKQTALRHVRQQAQRFLQRRNGFRFHRKARSAQFRREAHRPNQTHGVFAVARGGVANHADDALFHVLVTVVVIDHDLGLRVVIHGVDGEIAARGILVLRAPDVIAQHAPAGIDRVRHARERVLAGFFVAADLFGGGVVQISAESRNFNHLMFAPAPVNDMHDTKPPPDDESTAKQVFHLFGRGVGCYVEIFGR